MNKKTKRRNTKSNARKLRELKERELRIVKGGFRYVLSATCSGPTETTVQIN